jgi:IS30 family transposase
MCRERRSLGFIAKALGRHKSTISRELRRNKGIGPYDACIANGYATERRKTSRPKPKRQRPLLMRYVIDRLKLKWSPEQIACRTRIDHADNSSMYISHGTIYRHIHDDHRQKGQLYRHLRHARRKYDKRLAPCPGRGRIPDRVSIDERPQSVKDQTHIGDWEADTVFGQKGTGCIVSLVDRKSLYFIARLIPDLKVATFNRAVLEALKAVPKALRRTITCDNGIEFSGFKELQRKLSCKVYFAHPYSAWERGINENTNGLLRQFIPRKTNLKALNPQQLEEAVQLLNNRPRKKLGFRTPAEVFSEATVALQG